MDGIKAQCRRQRLKDRHHDDCSRSCVHKAADDHHCKYHQEEDQVNIGRESCNPGAQLVRKLQNRNTVAEDRGRRKDERALSHGECCRFQSFIHIHNTEFSVIKDTDQNTIESCNRTGLCRRENAA